MFTFIPTITRTLAEANDNGLGDLLRAHPGLVSLIAFCIWGIFKNSAGSST